MVNFVSHGLSKIAEEKTAKEETGTETERDSEGGSALDKYTTNLNQLGTLRKTEVSNAITPKGRKPAPPPNKPPSQTSVAKSGKEPTTAKATSGKDAGKAVKDSKE